MGDLRIEGAIPDRDPKRKPNKDSSKDGLLGKGKPARPLRLRLELERSLIGNLLVLSPEGSEAYASSSGVRLQIDREGWLELSVPLSDGGRRLFHGFRMGHRIYLSAEGQMLMKGEIVPLGKDGKITIAGLVSIHPAQAREGETFELELGAKQAEWEALSHSLWIGVDHESGRLDLKFKDDFDNDVALGRGVFNTRNALVRVPRNRILVVAFKSSKARIPRSAWFSWLGVRSTFLSDVGTMDPYLDEEARRLDSWFLVRDLKPDTATTKRFIDGTLSSLIEHRQIPHNGIHAARIVDVTG